MVRRQLGDVDREVFATSLGVSKNTLAHYERGERTPDADVLMQYGDRCHVDLNWLVTGRGMMFGEKAQPTAHVDPRADIRPDPGRLTAAIEAVEEGLQGRNVAASVKAELTIAAYDLLTHATAESRDRVIRLVKGA